ncbi:MAG: HAMP domain-containing protein, partial [Actinobacteria bacterium]|nr:HAMP domain-containing protein [Actinomycetota bacterium]
MNPYFFRFRNSLALKVIVSTVLLSVGVIYIAGSALNSQLSAGIKKVNRQSSIVEARSTIFSAQYRLLLVQGENNAAVRKVISNVISSATSLTSNENAREVVFLRSPGNTKSIDYEITSNLVDPSSIPDFLSTKVRKSSDIGISYVKIQYISGLQIPGLAIGQKISIPNAGQYEMYMIFSLANQNTTLKLIQRYLFLTGIALILLIGLITWLVIRQVVRPVRHAALVATQFTAGNFSERLEVRSQDEIAKLGKAFNEMAESL